MEAIQMQDSRLYEVRLVLAVSTYKAEPTDSDYDEALEFVLDSIVTSDCWVLDRQQTRLMVVPASEVTA